MVKYTPVSVLNPQMKGSALTFNCWPLFLWKSTWVGGRGWVITSEVRITIWIAGFFGIQLYQYDKDSNFFFFNSYDLQQNLLYHTLQMLWIYTEFWWAGLKVNNLCVFSKKKVSSCLMGQSASILQTWFLSFQNGDFYFLFWKGFIN